MKIQDEEFEKLLASEESHAFNETFVFRGEPEAKTPARIRKRVLIPVVAAAVVAIALPVLLLALRSEPEAPPEFSGQNITSQPQGESSQAPDSRTPDSQTPDSRISEPQSDPVSESETSEYSEPQISDEISEPEVPGDTSKAEDDTPSLQSDESVPEESSSASDHPVISYYVPSWYLPGELAAHTFTNKGASPHKSVAAGKSSAGFIFLTAGTVQTKSLNSNLDVFGGPQRVVSGRYVDITGVSNSSPHRFHGCLIYDAVKGEELCCTCLANELLPVKLGAHEKIVIDAPNVSRLLMFSTYDEKQLVTTGRWLYDIETGVLREVPLYTKHDNMMHKFAPDQKHIASHESNGRSESVYIIDVATLSGRCVSDGYETLMNSSTFSPDGTNLLIAVKDENGSYNGYVSESGKFLLVNATTLARCECRGKALSYADGLLVTHAWDGYHVYDREKCVEITPENGVSAIDVREDGIYLVNTKGGAEKRLGPAPDGYCISPDGRYIYTYNMCDYDLVCLSQEGESFNVRLSDEFVSVMLGFGADYKLNFKLSTNDAMDEVVVCYYDPNNKGGTMSAEDVRYLSIKEYIIRAFEAEYSTEKAFYYLENMFSNKLKGLAKHAFIGDGFAYVVLDYGMTQDGSETAIFFEDMRDNIFFVMYEGKDHKYLTPINPDWDEVGAYVKMLSSDEDCFRDFCKSFGIDVSEEAYDYAQFFKDGTFTPAEHNN